LVSQTGQQLIESMSEDGIIYFIHRHAWLTSNGYQLSDNARYGRRPQNSHGSITATFSWINRVDLISSNAHLTIFIWMRACHYVNIFQLDGLPDRCQNYRFYVDFISKFPVEYEFSSATQMFVTSWAPIVETMRARRILRETAPRVQYLHIWRALKDSITHRIALWC